MNAKDYELVIIPQVHNGGCGGLNELRLAETRCGDFGTGMERPRTGQGVEVKVNKQLNTLTP